MNSLFVLSLALVTAGPSAAPSPQGVPVSLRSLIPLPKKPKPKPAEDPVRGMELAKKAVTGFLSASSVEEMAKFVRNPQRALPRMMAHYAAPPPQPVTFTFGTDWKEVDRHGKTFVLSRITIAFEEVFICAEIPQKGEAMVDWESYTGWCEMPWAEFVKKGMEKPAEFRVALIPSDYFNFSYTDKENHVCFRLVDKDNSETVFAYCAKDSEVHKKIEEALGLQFDGDEPEAREKHITCTLKLSMKAADAVHRQAVIESFAREGWVEP